MIVRNVANLSDLTIRDKQANLRIAVLHLEQPRTPLKNLGILLHNERAIRTGDIICPIHSLEHIPILELQERERIRGLIVLLDRADSMPAPRLNLLNIPRNRLGNAILGNETNSNHPSRDSSYGISRVRGNSERGGRNQHATRNVGNTDKNFFGPISHMDSLKKNPHPDIGRGLKTS